MTPREASCSCGALVASCKGEPVSVSLCHCQACQRRTGSAYGIAAFYDEHQVSIRGKSKVYTRIAESGRKVAFHFCPECGASVFWYPEMKPDMVAVAVGAFAEAKFPAPMNEHHLAKKLNWVKELD